MNDATRNDAVAVVVDPFSRRFAYVAEIDEHDKEYGVLFLRFNDGARKAANDGSATDEPVMPEAVVLNRADEEKIQALQKRLWGLRRKLIEICNAANRYALPFKIRLSCRESFFDIVNSPFESASA